MAPRKIIHDCDPGQDDAMALLLELASPEAIELLAVTTIAGNVPVERATENARRVVELAGRADLPVHRGCARPLRKPFARAEEFHGESGLEGSGLPPAWLHPDESHAVEFLIDRLGRPNERVTLCATGPLTNVASALAADPDIAEKIEAIVLMGGALGRGNATPSAEFNFHVDPDAAAIVLSSGIDIVMIGLEATHQALATPKRIAAIEALGSPVGRAVAGMLRYGLDHATRRGAAGPAIHDVLVPAYLLRPALFQTRATHIRALAWGETDLGRSVELRSELPNVTLVYGVDGNGLFKLLTERLARFPKSSRK